jgi:glycosyltransferase involved in cell wall biosynthesis
MVPQARAGSSLTHDELCHYYQVEGPFRVLEVPALSGRFRPLQKAAHSAQAARVPGAFDVWYTRNLSSVAAGLAAGHRVVYEHFRPWPDQYPPLEPLLRGMMRHPKFLGAILHSAYARDSFRRIGVPEQKLTVVCNGFDPAKMEPRLDKAEARSAVGLPLDAKVVVYAGHVNARKGLDVLLDIAAECPHVLFVLVGSHGEGPIEKAARALANVRVVEWQRFDRTIVYLYAADVLVIPPSLSPLTQHGTTVLPMKLFTYLATGRVILGPRAADTATLLDDSNAVLVAPGDARLAAKALLALLADRG